MDWQYRLTVEELAAELKVKPSWVYDRTRRTGPGSIAAGGEIFEI